MSRPAASLPAAIDWSLVFEEMKQREEKQRKFHETLLNILYHQHPNSTSSSSSPSLQEDVLEAEPPSSLPLENSTTILSDSFDDLEEKEKSSSSSSSENNECGKLTRAQRKRFRKKKLKEAASRRQGIIGPLLLSTVNSSSIVEVDVVHQDEKNELQEPQSTSNVVEESKGSVQNKLKHRRTAKRRKQQGVDALCQVHSSCNNANEET